MSNVCAKHHCMWAGSGCLYCEQEAKQVAAISRDDARITVMREAMLMGYGLFMADAQIRELLAALDKIGKPLPAAQTITLGCPNCESSGVVTGIDGIRRACLSCASAGDDFPERLTHADMVLAFGEEHAAKFEPDPLAFIPGQWEQTR